MIPPAIQTEMIQLNKHIDDFQYEKANEILENIKEILKSGEKTAIEDEIADIAMYLTYLTHDIGIDLEKIMSDKLEKNRKKYPSDKVRGSAKKYDEY